MIDEGLHNSAIKRALPISYKEGALLLLLCCVAAARALYYGAAYPPFNNVDEQAHFDLAIRYSQGQPPRGLEPFAARSARLISLYGSPEYTYQPSLHEGRPVPPPVWEFSVPEQEHFLALVEPLWGGRIDHEGTQPPVYYAAAGCWLRLGEALGVRDAGLPYWLRSFDAGLLVLLQGLAFLCLGAFYPGRSFIRWGAVALLAFLPQSAFYSINNDAAAPLAFAAAFYALLEAALAEAPSTAFCAGAGLLTALAILVKLTDAPLLAVLVVAVGLRLRKGRGEAGRAAVLVGAAVLPLLAWSGRNYLLFGDFLGTALKARALGWTPKPLGQWLLHPIFTPAGSAYFVRELLETFWRGEFVWHGAELRSWLDPVYVLTSLVFLTAAAAAVVYRSPRENRRERFAGLMSLGVVLLSALALAAGSAAYDFGDCPYPSRAVPFIASGRLMLGTLVPFLALYLDGLERLSARLKPPKARWLFLGLLILGMACSELARSRAPAASLYNGFHAP